MRSFPIQLLVLNIFIEISLSLNVTMPQVRDEDCADDADDWDKSVYKQSLKQ